MLLNISVLGRSGDQRSPGGRAKAGLLVLAASAAWALTGSAAESNADTWQAPPLAELRKLPPIHPLVYEQTATDERIEAAQRKLVGACMAERGFGYRPGVPATSSAGPMPFGLESLDAAATTLPDDELPAEVTGDEAERYAQTLYGDPDARLTAQGSRMSVSRPETGCLAEAERRLLGDGRPRWMQLRVLLFEAEQEARYLVDQDPLFRAANARWAACMRGSGFPVPDPLELLESLPARTDLGAHPAARADVRCKQDVHYFHTAYARLAQMQRQVLAAEPAVLTDWERLMHRQATAADEVLGSP